MTKPPPKPDPTELIRTLHERPQMPLAEWLRAPAHVHYKAYRMSDPPAQRPASRQEFVAMLDAYQVPSEARVVRDGFGYGVKVALSGDRLIIVWQGHTEYYSYQMWHVPPRHHAQVAFGPITFPEYRLPQVTLGTEVCRLDIVLSTDPMPEHDALREELPGTMIYGSRLLDAETSVVTTFTHDQYGRERYRVSLGGNRTRASHLKDIVDGLLRIETYYHLLLMQKPLFSAAIDRVYQFEQVHMKQREIITSHIGRAGSAVLERWLNGLTQDLLKTNRLAGTLHFELSASLPYDRIVHTTLAALDERPMETYRPISDYVLSGVTGVAEGYQQLLKRIDTLRSGFEGIISIIRARVDLMLEAQNLELLRSVDRTTKSQVILQHTVEGLSVIVIAYYLSGLANYIFKGLYEMGVIKNPGVASAVFVPIAIALAFFISSMSRKYLQRKLGGEGGHGVEQKPTTAPEAGAQAPTESA
ncbi:MAG: DUF3422 family protein [Nitrospiraceae bacterium]